MECTRFLVDDMYVCARARARGVHTACVHGVWKVQTAVILAQLTHHRLLLWC